MGCVRAVQAAREEHELPGDSIAGKPPRERAIYQRQTTMRPRFLAWWSRMEFKAANRKRRRTGMFPLGMWINLLYRSLLGKNLATHITLPQSENCGFFGVAPQRN